MLHRHSNNKGFSLIEVLIAMIVISVGLLGVAAMQARSLLFNADASYRTQATFLATDIAERMRANSSVLASYAIAKTASAPGDPGCTAAICTTGAIATHDVALWITSVTNNLPLGEASITNIVAGSPTTLTITLFWTARTIDGTSEDSFILEVAI